MPKASIRSRSMHGSARTHLEAVAAIGVIPLLSSSTTTLNTCPLPKAGDLKRRSACARPTQPRPPSLIVTPYVPSEVFKQLTLQVVRSAQVIASVARAAAEVVKLLPHALECIAIAFIPLVPSRKQIRVHRPEPSIAVVHILPCMHDRVRASL